MRILSTLPILALVTAAPAAAHETLTEDFQVCMGGGGKLPAELVVGACTRLIDNAAAENEITGMFYGMRASVNADRAQNCSDAQKSLQLATDVAIKELSQKLIDEYC
jgi:hypothetical protein